LSPELNSGQPLAFTKDFSVAFTKNANILAVFRLIL
jgi:hypothetical protein